MDIRRLKKELLHFIPSSIMRRIDRSSYAIEQFVFLLSKEIPPGSKILDAGAGETLFKKFFTNHKYVAIDTKWGDSDWDY